VHLFPQKKIFQKQFFNLSLSQNKLFSTGTFFRLLNWDSSSPWKIKSPSRWVSTCINCSLPDCSTLGSSVHGQFDGRYPTPTKPLHSHKLLRNSSSKSPSGELYQHSRNNSNNSSFNVSHLSQNPHTEAQT